MKRHFCHQSGGMDRLAFVWVMFMGKTGRVWLFGVPGAGIPEETVCGLRDSYNGMEVLGCLAGWAFFHHRSKACTFYFLLSAQKGEMVFEKSIAKLKMIKY